MAHTTLDAQNETQLQAAIVARRLPPIYREATWRNTTPVDDVHKEIGLSFNCGNDIVRVRLDMINATHVMETLSNYLADHRARVHSSSSSGMPSCAVSTPDE